MGHVNPDALVDWSRSVRAFTLRSFVNRHPWNFIVDPDVTNETKSTSKIFTQYEKTNQANVYAGADTFANNKSNLEVFIRPMSSFD